MDITIILALGMITSRADPVADFGVVIRTALAAMPPPSHGGTSRVFNGVKVSILLLANIIF